MIHWIASYPKSGNTWIRMFLTAYLNGGKLDINKPHGATDMCPVMWGLESHSGPKVELLEYAMLRPAVLLKTALLWKSHDRPEPLTMKTHCLNGNLYDIPLIPGHLSSNSVYILRDPRDVAISWAYHLDCSIDEAIDLMNEDKYILTSNYGVQQPVGGWNNHVRSWASKGNVLVVRYEDMLTNTAKAFAHILRHLGVAIDDGNYGQAIRVTRLGNLQEQEQSCGFNEQSGGRPFFRRGGSHWQKVLTQAQADKIWANHGDVMQEHGYHQAEVEAA